MNGFFHGWRRKVGTGVLAVACAIAIVWFRGYLVHDIVTVRVGTHLHVIEPFGGFVLVSCYSGATHFDSTDSLLVNRPATGAGLGAPVPSISKKNVKA